MADLLVDTDVCIDHLDGVKRLPRTRPARVLGGHPRRSLAGGLEHEAAVRRLLAGMDEIVVDRRVADRAGELRRSGLRMPDALIAATALVHQLTLLSRNVTDFRKAPGLRVRSPGSSS